MVEVTQADRDAAADFWRDNHNVPPSVRLLIRDGERDDNPLVQAFSRHRQAGIEEGLERAFWAGNLEKRVNEAILIAMNTAGISQRDLAKEMGVTAARVCQLLGDNTNLSLKTVDRVFEAIRSLSHRREGVGK